MSTRNISDTKFTIDWLENILLRECQTKAKIENISVSEIGFGRGFMSKVLIVELDWNPNSELLPQSVALKISNATLQQSTNAPDELDEESRKKGILKQDTNRFYQLTHNCEVTLYTAFRAHPPKGLKVPKCYFAQEATLEQHGVLVMNDLSEGTTRSFAGGLTLDEILEVVQQIAVLHAYSLTNKSWREFKFNVNFENVCQPSFPTSQLIAAKVIQSMKKEHPEMFGSLVDSMMEHCKSMEDVSYVYSLNEALDLPDVIVQGDVHAQNLIFEKSIDGRSELKAILDWQIAHPGNLAEDIVRLLASSADVETRRNHWMQILRHYYASLKEALGTKPPYSFEMVVKSYKRAFKSGVLCILPPLKVFGENDRMLEGFDDKEKKKNENRLKLKALLEDVLLFESEL